MVTVTDRHVEFTFFRRRADRVEIVGDFNDWRPGELPMQPMGDGHWRAVLLLPAGVFRFRYLADGEPFTDYAAFGLEPSEQDRTGLDSVVRVPEPPSVPNGPDTILPDRRLA